jgi:predicted nuclease with RNAse H fold
MGKPIQIVVGIDVGGAKKGFHAVALRGDVFVDKTSSINPAVIFDWCIEHKAIVVAVDAPCGWSRDGWSSREAERILGKQGIYCFATPTRERALHRDFYKWVFNGQNLYECLTDQYPLFDGQWTKKQTCIETFPQAIACALVGQMVSARHKSKVRRDVLRNRGYDNIQLPNIDFVDAALCAIAADKFHKANFQKFGNREEGFIVVPA